MKTLLKLSLFVLFFNLLFPFSEIAASGLIPIPLQIIPSKDKAEFVITPTTRIVLTDKRLMNEAEELRSVVQNRSGLQLEIINGKTPEKGALNLVISDEVEGVESYVLEVNEKKIVISGATTTGVFYGIKTLDQLLLGDGGGNLVRRLSALKIIDSPRFEFRALMIDPARHFIPLEDVKRYIDQMSKFKFNVLHLHLTDDQGWRIEIKKYPLLTEIGSKRKETDGNGRPHEGFYTQEQIKELVDYAATKHVELIPEIDIPGHSVAAIAAYPWLSCKNQPIGVRTTAGVSKDLLCAGNEKVYEFYMDVINEVCALFPSKKFHLGGDEAPLDHWKECQKCQAFMKNKGFEREQQLMSHFFNRMNAVLTKNGKTPLFWYELDVPDYPTNTITYAWRMGLASKVIERARQLGCRVICAPGEHAYFDYPQFPGDMPEVNWGMPVTTLRKVYEFDPGYGLPKEQQSHIMGVEATLWGECIKNIDRAFYMTFPRALALSEAGWSVMENRNWKSFVERMYPNLSDLMREGISFRVPYEVIEKRNSIRE